MWSGGGRRGPKAAQHTVVPAAEFASYYGRPVIKAPVWKHDIPLYLFAGGMSGGASLLAAGADLSGRPDLRRAGRLTAFGGILASTFFLINDLGRPSRFHHMLRVAKPTSPMSMGTWILTAYGPMAGAAGTAELTTLLPPALRDALPTRLLRWGARPAGLAAAATAPLLASYTAVLLADTAVPTWHEAYPELPFVFVGSAAAAGAGMGLIFTRPEQAGPARRQALIGAVGELVAAGVMERRLGLLAEPLEHGRPGALLRAARLLTVAGVVCGSVGGRRNRAAAVTGGAALVVGSLCTRLGIYYGGVTSAKDPKYTVVPQRRRLNEGRPARYEGPDSRSGQESAGTGA